MWIVENKTPFKAQGTFKRDKDGAEVWIVVAKATFDLLTDGVTRISDEQEDVVLAPVFHGEPEQSSLKYDADLVLEKPATDVVLNGSAHAPKRKPVRSLDVGLFVGPVQKILTVTGERMWMKKVWTSETKAVPFTTLPLVYERAWGGTDERNRKKKKHGFEPANPVGTGFAMKSAHRDKQKAPNIEYADSSLSRKQVPACFGPIPCHWEPRLSLGGTYDENWQLNRSPLLPLDFNPGYFQQAPKDQQVPGYLKGGETVTLKNLHPQSDYAFDLPKINFRAMTHIGSDLARHDFHLHTVIIEPDDSRLMMVWHTALPCHGKDHLLEKTTVMTDAPIKGKQV